MNPTRMLAALAAVIAFSAPGAQAAAPTAGDVAPDAVGKTASGQPVLLSAHAGKVVVVSFWATWCGYCLKELPILEGIQKLTGKQHNVQVIAVNTEERDTFRRITRVMKDFTLAMANDEDKTGQAAYGVKGIPHLVIIGRDGVIIRVYRGYGEETLGQITADINLAISAPAARQAQ